MQKTHQYTVNIEWTGNQGSGTSGYRTYGRNHAINAKGKGSSIDASSDPAFLGDATRYNPEELLLASLASCHMLWFLHLCADRGIVVTSYTDTPTAEMTEGDGAGRFVKAILNPDVVVSGKFSPAEIEELHQHAYEQCFIANSVNFPVVHAGKCRQA